MTAEFSEQQTGASRSGAIGDPRLALLLAYWQELRNGDRVPPRSAVDPSALPADLRPLLPHFFLYEVIRRPVLDYRMRLAGSMLCATVGYEMRGKMFDEIHPLDQSAAIRREFDEAVSSGRPHYAERSAQWLPDKELPYRRLLLPFADDGVTVDSLGGASVFALDQRPPF